MIERGHCNQVESLEAVSTEEAAEGVHVARERQGGLPGGRCIRYSIQFTQSKMALLHTLIPSPTLPFQFLFLSLISPSGHPN